MIKHWIFSCKDVSSLISRSMDQKLPFSTRLGIEFHLMMCKLCRRYEKQLLILEAAFKEEIIIPLPKPIQEKIDNLLKTWSQHQGKALSNLDRRQHQTDMVEYARDEIPKSMSSVISSALLLLQSIQLPISLCCWSLLNNSFSHDS